MAPYRGRYASARGFVRAFRRAGHQTLPAASLRCCRRRAGKWFDPRNFDVAVVAYFDKSLEKPSVSPGIFHSGFWHVRTDKGAMVLADGASLIHRVI
jgi:hypothetical protein